MFRVFAFLSLFALAVLPAGAQQLELSPSERSVYDSIPDAEGKSRYLRLTLAAKQKRIDAGMQTATEEFELSGGQRPSIRPVTPPVTRFESGYKPGTVIIDTQRRRLLYVLSGTQAYLYPVSVGRDGFQWTGSHKITAKRDWPDWRPPAEMRARDPGLPMVMTGGLENPLGAKALYLGSTLYRIHGTNNKSSIGRAASSGCFRMLNGHVAHLARLTRVGTNVHVLNALPTRLARSFAKPTRNRERTSPRVAPSTRVAQRPTVNRAPRLVVRRPEPTRRQNMAWRRSILGLN